MHSAQHSNGREQTSGDGRTQMEELQCSRQMLMQDDIAFKLLLTGTPVQNDLSELWSLLWFLQPDVFDNKKIFVDEYEIVSNQPPSRGLKEILSTLSSESERITLARTTMDQLHDLLRPFLLRRIKDECNLNIPPKREIILKTRLTKLQKEIYKNLLLKNYNLIGNVRSGFYLLMIHTRGIWTSMRSVKEEFHCHMVRCESCNIERGAPVASAFHRIATQKRQS